MEAFSDRCSGTPTRVRSRSCCHICTPTTASICPDFSSGGAITRRRPLERHCCTARATPGRGSAQHRRRTAVRSTIAPTSSTFGTGWTARPCNSARSASYRGGCAIRRSRTACASPTRAGRRSSTAGTPVTATRRSSWPVAPTSFCARRPGPTRQTARRICTCPEPRQAVSRLRPGSANYCSPTFPRGPHART